MSSTIASDFDGLQVTIGNLASRMLVVVDGHGCAINQIPVTVTSRSYSTLKVGSHCRSMLIVQPPVLCMKMMISCCATKRGDSFDDDGWGGRSSPMATRIDFTAVDDATDHHSDTAGEEREEDETTSLTSADAMHNAKVAETLEIRCHSGITVGHIHDAVQKLRETHRKCPHASLHEHDKDGTVRPEITFTAILELKKDEPYIFEKDRAYVRDRLSSLRCDMDSLGMPSGNTALT